MDKFLEVEGLDSLRRNKAVYWIDPMDIKYLPQKDFRIDDFDEKSSGGDWDRDLSLLKRSDFYQAAEDVFFNDKAWNDTSFFSGRLQKAKICCEEDRDRYKLMRCNYINYLFNAMRSFGYVQDPNSDLVGILIGRNGEVILNNGRHRVVIAQLLGIDAIPCTIDVRHSEWMRFCDGIMNYMRWHDGMIYAPIRHIDLAHLPTRQKDRIDCIVRSMSPKNNTLVDLGANWGGMCRDLELFDIKCVAVESDPKEFHFLKILRTVYDGNYEIVLDDVVDFINKRNRFDCVLMLSILHHIPAKRREELISKIDAREMFFQFPSKKEAKVDVIEGVKFILSNSRFRNVKQIGDRSDREMFHFTR